MLALKQLSTILTYYQQLADQALQQFAASQQQVSAAQQQLAQLAMFLQQYNQDIHSMATISATSLRNRANFISTLSQSQQQQHLYIEQLQQQAQQLKKQWQQANTRVDSIDLLMNKLEQQQRYQLTKKEQKLMDEWNSRKR